jgi:uncharacterized membrane protein
MDEVVFGATFAAALGAGLIGGVFFAFSSFVMAALARVPGPEGIRAMQAINVTVHNRGFLSIFTGTGIIGAVAAVLASIEFDSGSSLLTIAGALLYIAGCLGVTGARNVPRNNALDKLAADAPASEPVWRTYLREWTLWNTVRTVACLAAAAAFTIALAIA